MRYRYLQMHIDVLLPGRMRPHGQLAGAVNAHDMRRLHIALQELELELEFVQAGVLRCRSHPTCRN